MAAVETSSTTETRNIQRQMARARLEIHQDVGGAVNGVQLLTNWRTIVRSHPWLSLAIAATLGYAVIPRRSARHGARSQSSDPPPDAGATALSAESAATDGLGKWEPLSSAFAWIAPIAARLVQTYVSQYLESWLAEHAFGRAPSEPARAEKSAMRPVSEGTLMLTFDWTWIATRGGSSREVDDRAAQHGGENAAVPRSCVDCTSAVNTMVNDRPALALGIAFMAGATLGWMIKRW